MIFDFLSYRPYLEARVGKKGQRTGRRKLLAEHLGVHTTFVSQVILGKAELSLEQAEGCNSFLGHTENESEYFLYLVLKDRAGIAELKDRFKAKIDNMREHHLNIKKRLSAEDEVIPEDQVEFYSTTIYPTIHVLSSIPEFQPIEKMCAKMKMSREEISPYLEFLIRLNIVDFDGKRITTGRRHIHLGNDSNLIKQHHTNWKLKTIQSLEKSQKNDVHYSAIVSLSKSDAYKIKQALLKSLEENARIIGDSKEEEAFVYSFDFFEV